MTRAGCAATAWAGAVVAIALAVLPAAAGGAKVGAAELVGDWCGSWITSGGNESLCLTVESVDGSVVRGRYDTKGPNQMFAGAFRGTLDGHELTIDIGRTTIDLTIDGPRARGRWRATKSIKSVELHKIK